MPIHGCRPNDDAAMDDTLVPFRARMLDKLERQYLDIDAQGLAYRYMAMGDVPADVIEKAIQEAIYLGRMKNAQIDSLMFTALVEALLEDRTFDIHGAPMELINMCAGGSWYC